MTWHTWPFMTSSFWSFRTERVYLAQLIVNTYGHRMSRDNLFHFKFTGSEHHIKKMRMFEHFIKFASNIEASLHRSIR